VNKQTKTFLTVGALAAVAYYFWKNSNSSSPATPGEVAASGVATAPGIVGSNLSQGLPGFQLPVN